jgi:hypothetical protein
MYLSVSVYVSVVELNGKHTTGSQRTRWEQQSKKGIMQKVGTEEEDVGWYM